MDTKIIDMWNKLHTCERFCPKYPEDSVVRFVFKYLKHGQNVLDLGCGAGRHTVFLAENGYNAYGIDISKNGIDKTNRRLKEKNLTAICKVASVESIPFEDGFFDSLISCGSFYYGDTALVKKAINEIFRVLKPKGLAFLCVRSLEDYRFNKNYEIEPHTIIVHEVNKDKSAAYEDSMKMHFFDREELTDLLSNFSKMTIDRQIVTHDDEKFSDNDFLVYLEK